VSKSTLLAVSTLLNPESLNRERVAAERHLTEISTFGNLSIETSKQDNFYNYSWTYFRVVLASAVRLLAGDQQHKLLVKGLTACCRRLNAPLWSTLVRKAKSEDWPVWLFLVERLLLSQHLVGPSPLWLRTAAKLTPSNNSHWQLLRLYPKRQPDLPGTIRARQRKWTSADGGWLRDAIESAPLTDLTGVKRLRIINRIATQHRANEDSITMEGWVRFSKTIERHNMFDPRCGEWTALELFKHVMIAAARTHVQPTPFNISLDAQLASSFPSSNGSPPTWESWRAICQSARVNITNNTLSDYRLEFTTIQHESPPSYSPIIYGLLLSMLLSKSLDLPELWNLPGFSGARLGLIFSRIEHLAISSATNVILEQCLAPRYVEYRSERQQPRVDDSTINRWLTRMVSVVAGAQEILSQYQTTIQHYQSRQLIPVDIFQLRSQFAETPSEDNG
jgi:hypothetical protein